MTAVSAVQVHFDDVVHVAGTAASSTIAVEGHFVDVVTFDGVLGVSVSTMFAGGAILV